MSEKELDQEVAVQEEGQIEEAKASFGVDAEVPEPSTKENTPPGSKPKDEDKNKNPEQGSSVKPTKVKAINKIVDAVKGMKNEEVQKLLAMLEGKEEVEAEVVAETIKMSELRQVTAEDVDVSEDIKAMFSGEELTEDFTKKATTIFEAAVVSKVNEILENVTVDMEAEMEAAKEEIKESLATEVDGYMSYVAEEWVKENELAIEQGIKSEIMENFMAGLKDLFVENYIDIPEEKVDFVEEMAAKIEELEAQFNEQVEKNIELKAEIAESVKAQTLAKTTEGLTESQAIKLASLAEGVEFEDAETYAEKLETIKENYFGEEVDLSEEVNMDEEIVETEEESSAPAVAPEMTSYMNAIAKSIKK
jgi:hypothetical protein